MNTNLLNRLKKLEATVKEEERLDLAGLSDEELERMIEELARKAGYIGPMEGEDFDAFVETVKAELNQG